MWLILGIFISAIMGACEWATIIDVGWWWIAPAIIGLVIQILAWTGGGEAAGCLGDGIEAIADIFT